MKSKTTNIKFNISNPRKNLPDRLKRKRGESNFANSFQRKLQSQERNRGIWGKEFALAGFGIADIIWIAPKNNNSISSHTWSITAFETKLKDWRRALTQAYRYKYYANRSIVVMPYEHFISRNGEVELFKKSNIGLWYYNVRNGEIKKLFTPRYKKASYKEVHEKAKSLILGKIYPG